jgi:arsenite methyltransferase
MQDSDIWSRWLLARRHGSDPAYQPGVMAAVERYRERVLDFAKLQPGNTLLDVGTGDGLIAFGAIARIGPSLNVILSDLSEHLLERCRKIAIERGVLAQCHFVRADADHLAGVADQSVDVVTTRSVLAYVADKPAALGEMFRVLRPGGRISISEPIFHDDALEAHALGKLIDVRSDHPDIPFLKLLQRWKSAQFPSNETEIAQNPLTNYTERDLVRMAVQCGFTRVHLELHIDHIPAREVEWDFYINSSAHPWSPTLGEFLVNHFSAEERKLFEGVMRPVIESGNLTTIERVAYLTAEKPAR